MKTKSKKDSQGERLNEQYWMSVLALYRDCLRNAEDLIDEANLLFDHRHYARAFFLSITAYEEIGKSQIVADLFNGMASKKEFDEAFKRHEIKSAYVSRNYHFDSNPPFNSEILYEKKKSKQLLNWRMSALYVDCDDKYNSKKPSERIKKDDAKQLIDIVKRIINDIHNASVNSERIGSASFLK